MVVIVAEIWCEGDRIREEGKEVGWDASEANGAGVLVVVEIEGALGNYISLCMQMLLKLAHERSICWGIDVDNIQPQSFVTFFHKDVCHCCGDALNG